MKHQTLFFLNQVHHYCPCYLLTQSIRIVNHSTISDLSIPNCPKKNIKLTRMNKNNEKYMLWTVVIALGILLSRHVQLQVWSYKVRLWVLVERASFFIDIGLGICLSQSLSFCVLGHSAVYIKTRYMHTYNECISSLYTAWVCVYWCVCHL